MGWRRGFRSRAVVGIVEVAAAKGSGTEDGVDECIGTAGCRTRSVAAAGGLGNSNALSVTGRTSSGVATVKKMYKTVNYNRTVTVINLPA